MPQLPNDVLNEIFSHLHQFDKVECMLVCHLWKEIIEEFTLYQTVVLNNKLSLDILLEKVQESPDIGCKIQQLTILRKQIGECEINLNKLLLLLPKLQILFASKSLLKDGEKDVLFDETIQYPWHKSIKHVYDINKTEPKTYQMLSSFICSNLSTLIIDLDENNQVISLLHNAPSLRALTLIGRSIDFNDLEILHDNAPRLISLTLYSLDIMNEGFMESVTPTINITRFALECSYLKDAHIANNLLMYISKKYPNILELYCEADFYVHYTARYHALHVTSHGWTPFFQNIGSQLRKLSFYLGKFIGDFFEIFDESKLQINTLEFNTGKPAIFMKMIQSQQIYYLQNLTLIIGREITFEWLGELRVLKKLSLIHDSGGDLNVTDVLTYSPLTLKSLSLQNIGFTVDPEYTGESHVRSLYLLSMRLPENSDTFIDRHFPKLSKLKLNCCDAPEKAFKLPTLDLSVFGFYDFYPRENNCNILINTYSNNESRLYSIKNSACLKEPMKIGSYYNSPYRSYPANKTSPTPHFTFSCHSLKSVRFRTGLAV